MRAGGSRLASGVVWGVVLASAGLPVVWLAVNAVVHGGVSLRFEGFPLAVHARTLGLSLVAAVAGGLLGIFPGIVLARATAWVRWGLGTLMLGVLVVPGPVWSYVWAELAFSADRLPRPGSPADLLRCVWTGASRLWPVPAAAVAWGLWRLDPDVLDVARLDGARRRVATRLVGAFWVGGVAGAMLLATQELATYDQSGLVVTPTLVREAYVVAGLPGTDQRVQIARATWVALPVVLAGAAAGVVGWRLTRPVGTDTSPGHVGRAGRVAWASTLVVLAVVLLPGVWTVLRVSDATSVAGWVAVGGEFGPQITRGLGMAGATGAIVAGLALLGVVGRPGPAAWISVICLLAGGQFVALGWMRIWAGVTSAEILPQPAAWVLDDWYLSGRLLVWAHVGMLAWVGLAAGAWTWSAPWTPVRQAAAVDGAGPWSAAWRVVLPSAWPLVLAAAVVTTAAAFTEVAAATLMVPDTLINVLMTYMHILTYAPTARAAALTIGIIAVLSVTGALLVWAAARVRPTRGIAAGVACVALLLSTACDMPPQPIDVWTGYGEGDGKVVYPRAITYSRHDRGFWIIDRNARVQHFDGDGNFTAGWKMPEWGFGKPVGVSTDGDGNVWIPDTHYGRVIVYTPGGEELLRFGSQGQDDGQFIFPTDVLHLPDGRILVSEYGGNDRIHVYRRLGPSVGDGVQLVGYWGRFGEGPGEFRRPQAMVVLGDTVWVVDACNHRLVAFDFDGNFLASVGDEGGVRAGGAAGRFRFPMGMDTDGQGMLVVAEFGNNRLQRIDPATGRSLGTWGSPGGRPGQFKYPWAVAFNPADGTIVAADAGNNRMQVMRFEDVTASVD